MAHFGWLAGELEAQARAMNWEGIGSGEIPYLIPAIYMLVIDIMVYILLAIYFMEVLPETQGLEAAQKHFFFLRPSYWKNRSRPAPRPDVQVRGIKQQFEVSELDPSKSWFQPQKKTIHAVAGVDLTIPQGTIFGLLGHNGAGKTTLINILTGKILPSDGDAEIGGYSVRKDFSLIRASGVVGTCPQFDTLYNELTAQEHVALFSELRGLTRDDPQARELLEAVDLA